MFGSRPRPPSSKPKPPPPKPIGGPQPSNRPSNTTLALAGAGLIAGGVVAANVMSSDGEEGVFGGGSGGGSSVSGSSGPDCKNIDNDPDLTQEDKARRKELCKEPDWNAMGPAKYVVKPFWKIYDVIRDFFLRGKFVLQDFLSYLPYIIIASVLVYLAWTRYIGSLSPWGWASSSVSMASNWGWRRSSRIAPVQRSVRSVRR